MEVYSRCCVLFRAKKDRMKKEGEESKGERERVKEKK
jgi:hypothetical protein